MNRDSLKVMLDDAGISRDDYLIDGDWDDRVCLELDDQSGRWQVFYSNRGSKAELRSFDSEAAACWNLYARVVKNYVRSDRIGPADQGD